MIMTPLRTGVVLALGIACALPALAYEVGTHAWMTNEAFLRS